MKKDGSRVASFSGIAQVIFQIMGQPEVDLVASSHTTQCKHYYILENPLSPRAFELNAFNYPCIYQITYTQQYL